MAEKFPTFASYEKVKADIERKNLEQTALHELAKNEAFHQIEEILEEDSVVGTGEQADVFRGLKMPGEPGGEQEKILVLKQIRERKPWPINTPSEEMRFQAHAHIILEEEAKTKPCARVPRPEFYARTDADQEFIAMEQIDGKTLFRLVLEKSLESLLEEESSVELDLPDHDDISDITDQELVIALLKSKGYQEQSIKKMLAPEITRICMEKFKIDSFLSSAIVLQMENGLKALHKKPLYHRDLHEKNIMISNDLTQAYIIDFDRSSYQNPREDQNYLIGLEAKFNDDKDILKTLLAITKKDQ